jgi:hypothetical protein
MLTEEGGFWITLVLFLIGIFAGGYFMGWSRDKLSAKIFDKMFYYLERASYWEGRIEDVIEERINIYEMYMKLQKYTVEEIGAEHVPTEFGGELG